VRELLEVLEMSEPHVLKIDMPLEPGVAPLKADETAKKLFDDAHGSIVQTRTENGRGTGFAVGPNLFVTDAHCVQGDKEIKIIAQDGTRYKARVLDIDDINDLAMLEIVSDKRINFKPLPLGRSSELKPDDRIFALGHPRGLRDIYISPGYYREHLTQEQFWRHDDRPDLADANYFKLTPKEAGDFSEFQKRSLISGRVHIEHGNSGGPLIDKTGNVVGVSDLGVNDKFSSDTYYTPVERVNAMLGRATPKFKFHEQWESDFVSDYKNAFAIHPAETIAATGAVAYGAKWARKMSGKSEAAGVLGGVMIFDDASNLYSSDHVRDRTKYGVATTGDAMMVAGGTLSALDRFKVYEKLLGQAGAYGKYIAAGGFAVRIGAEFVPNRLAISDMTRADGEPRAPFAVDMHNLTAKSKAEREAEQAAAVGVNKPEQVPAKPQDRK
jgi:hypothetical protein